VKSRIVEDLERQIAELQREKAQLIEMLEVVAGAKDVLLVDKEHLVIFAEHCLKVLKEQEGKP